MTRGAMTRQDVVDVCSLVYDGECWLNYLERLAVHAPEYLSVFAGSFARFFAIPQEAWRSALHADGPAGPLRLVAATPRPLDVDAYLEARAAQGVVAEIAMGSPGILADGTRVNERVAALAAASGGRIHAWAGISLREAAVAERELRRGIDLGMRGLAIIPFLDDVDVTAPHCARVFDLAAEHRLGLWLHTGHHYARRVPLDVSSWRHLDVLAGRYPELSVVAGHAAWPWVREAVSVALRHGNVYLEISSHRPRSLAGEGGGWEPLLRLGGRPPLRGRVLFGTSTWVNPVPVGDLTRELLDLGLPGQTARAWLSGNALQMLHQIDERRR
jgi:uncharacterized protein